MNNIHLNPGGIIGGLLVPAVGIAAVVLFWKPDAEDWKFVWKGMIAAVIGGAIVGNWIWGKLFPRPS